MPDILRTRSDLADGLLQATAFGRDQRLKHRLFAVEIHIERTLRHPRRLGDILYRGGLEPMRQEHPPRAIKDLAAFGIVLGLHRQVAGITLITLVRCRLAAGLVQTCLLFLHAADVVRQDMPPRQEKSFPIPQGPLICILTERFGQYYKQPDRDSNPPSSTGAGSSICWQRSLSERRDIPWLRRTKIRLRQPAPRPGHSRRRKNPARPNASLACWHLSCWRWSVTRAGNGSPLAAFTKKPTTPICKPIW